MQRAEVAELGPDRDVSVGTEHDGAAVWEPVALVDGSAGVVQITIWVTVGAAGGRARRRHDPVGDDQRPEGVQVGVQGPP